MHYDTPYRTQYRGVFGNGSLQQSLDDDMTKHKSSDVSQMIRKLRATLGLTQVQFAAKLGVTWSTVNRWENGRGKPSPLARQHIEELLCEADTERDPASTGGSQA